MKKFLISLIAFIAFAVSYAQMPKAVLKDINGKPVAADTIGCQGQPVIIDFFATWCKPCRRELNAIAECYGEWSKEGVRVVAISTDMAQNVQKVKPLATQEGWPFQVLLDEKGDMKRAMGVNTVPAVFVVDGKGQIIYRHVGYTDGGEEELIEAIRKNRKGGK